MKGRAKIDWQEVRARLERHRGALERALVPGPERIAAVYRDRAAKLARPPAPKGSGGGDRPMLLFALAGARYGIELSRVSEILAHPFCAPAPGAPPQVAGVVQVRGEIRPVWELSRLLGLADLTDAGFVLLLRVGARELGLRVGTVEGIRAVRTDELVPAQPDSAAAKWITPDLVTILDPDKLWEEDLK